MAVDLPHWRLVNAAVIRPQAMFMLPDRTLRKWREARHARLAQAVLETPPVRVRDDRLIV